MSKAVCNQLWTILDDFNAIRNINEKKGELDRQENYRKELNLCCMQANLKDLRYLRAFYTWNNKNEGDRLIASKLDRILVY